jgi:hypothetical protein
MKYFGDFLPGATVRIPFHTSAANGASITLGANGTTRIYKAAGTTERNSANGVTLVKDFDTITGRHYVSIDLSDNADAGFYVPGEEYAVSQDNMTIDSLTVNAWIGAFSIARMHGQYAMFAGDCSSNGTSTTIVDTALTESGADFWKGRVVIFTSGNLKGQATKITAFNATDDTLTVETLTAAPASGDRYLIV